MRWRFTKKNYPPFLCALLGKFAEDNVLVGIQRAVFLPNNLNKTCITRKRAPRTVFVLDFHSLKGDGENNTSLTNTAHF